MHPIRATRMTWEMALDQAVQNGLNLITMYVFWSAHQPFPDQPYQWSLVDPLLQTSTSDKTETGTYFQEWELADAIASCARRGLFVHIRIGPYVCAEYSYGGIPEWLPLSVDNLRMRRLDPAWMQAMEMYVANITAYLSQHQLWATQRGPIILAQIENELGEETTGYMQDNKVSEKHQTSASNTTTPSHSSIQEYANWCGSIAAKYIPEGVVLTMCNGLSANNTVDTHNGDSQFIGWLEHYGDNGRIQIDQPALWTEDEGGFQLWGEESGNPVDYFWGHTARYMTKRALQWFARGGCHLNYYMVRFSFCLFVFSCCTVYLSVSTQIYSKRDVLTQLFVCFHQWWGGYNRARMAAAGILNAYATDTVLCSSGQRHQPKFDHFQAMHTALADVSDVLMASPSALFNNKSVDVLSGGTWKPGDYQTMFVYRLSHRQQMREVMFVENNADTKCTVRVHVKALKEPLVFDISPDSAVMIVDGNMRFDSGLIDPNANAYVRREQSESVQLLNWSFWSELIEEAPDSALSAPHPIEQTDLAVSLHSSSDYAFYRTSFDLEDELETSSWCIQTQKGNGIIVFVDGTYIGSAENHEHSEGDVSVNIVSQRRLLKGNHTLSILSVSFGYHNLIGRWTAKVGAKQKGITGQVSLISPQLYDGRLNLDDGRTWTSDSGLKAGPTQIVQSGNSFYFGNLPLWSSTNFFAPHQYDATKVGLFVKLTDGRGNFFLNGIDLGRFWNITRGETDMLSMTSYFLPPDFLLPGKKMNSLVFFNEFGQWFKRPTMFLSWLEPSEQSAYFPDEVDYESSCVF